MRVPTDTQSVIVHIVARDVAKGVELARSLGYDVPKNYDVGVRFIQEIENTRVRIRMDDVTYDSVVCLPDLDGRHSLQFVSEMWKEAWIRIHADALTLIHVWIDKHTEVTNGKTSEALRKLKEMSTDDTTLQEWIREGERRVRECKFTPSIRDLFT